MKRLNYDKVAFPICLSLGTILMAGILLSIDFLYAGVQELFLVNINPDYIPDTQLAKVVIIASSIALAVGAALYALNIWVLIRKKKVQERLVNEQIIDQDGSVNFKTFQVEISSSIKILRDLFGFLVIIVLISGLFSFFRFIWMISKYRFYSELFIHYFLNNTSSIIISISLYIAIGLMMTYMVITSLQKYQRLQIIAKNYDKAMDTALGNFGKLMTEDAENKEPE